jgi:hypothetical protein
VRTLVAHSEVSHLRHYRSERRVLSCGADFVVLRDGNADRISPGAIATRKKGSGRDYSAGWDPLFEAVLPALPVMKGLVKVATDLVKARGVAVFAVFKCPEETKYLSSAKGSEKNGHGIEFAPATKGPEDVYGEGKLRPFASS